MNITTGLFEHMVLQRNGRNVSEAVITGECGGSGAITARITQNGKAVTGFAAARVGKATGRKFQAVIKGLPAGGPYDVELQRVQDGRVVESHKVSDVLVGDVWILGGQSNMQGVGRLSEALKPNKNVRAFYMTDTWNVAAEPIHQLSCAVDVVHTGPDGPKPPPKVQHVGVCPGLGFGHEMLRRTGVPQGLIACGHGGTSMSQWSPKLKNLGGGSLYGATYRRFRKNGSRVAGIVWYQGCSDANNDAAPLFTQRMKDLVRAFRKDFRDPRLPIATVQISRVVNMGGNERPWNSVQDQQRRMAAIIPGLATVPAIDLELDDLIHISGASQNVLGRRLADAMCYLKFGPKMGMPPIELDKITIETDPISANGNIVITYKNVSGELTAPGRPAGFLVSQSGGPTCVYRIKLDGKRVILRTSCPAADLHTREISYGPGLDPYCNIVDSSGRSLPVMGPLAMGEPRAMTPFGTNVSVSPLMPSAGKLKKLTLPRSLKSLKLTPRVFPGQFCDRHVELGKIAPQDALIWFAYEVSVPEKMKLSAQMGYDGPVKMWIDGKLKYQDPAGINPAAPTDACVAWKAAPGKHQVVVAMSSNNGQAWGIFFRLERLGISKATLAKGDGAYTLPIIKPLEA